MSNLIGEGEPSGARGKFLFGLFNLCLVTAVGLHAIMKLEHDMVVFRPPTLSYMQKAGMKERLKYPALSRSEIQKYRFPLPA
jgi:hypothetical protein